MNHELQILMTEVLNKLPPGPRAVEPPQVADGTPAKAAPAVIDAELPADAGVAVRAVKLALIESPARRAIAAFLRREDAPNVNNPFGILMHRLLMECLPAFVRDNGGKVAHGLRFDQGEYGDPVEPFYQNVRVDGVERPYMVTGLLFLHFEEQRAVVVSTPLDTNATVLAVHSDRDAGDFLTRWKDFARGHNYLRGRPFLADGEIIQRDRRPTWDDVLLPEAAKTTIRLHVEGFLRRRGELRALGVKPRRGLILAGPPGTGKTSVAKVLESTPDVSTMWVTPRFVQMPGQIPALLEAARFVAPTLVVLEDLDLFADEREGGGGSMTLGELMNQLDGAVDNEDLVVIATTNRLDTVEKALRNRPGRFDRVVELGPPDAHCRRRILIKLLEKARIASCDLDFAVEATDGCTGAQIEELVNTVFLHTLVASPAPAEGAPRPEDGIRVGRAALEAALAEVAAERRSRIGY